MGRLPEGRGLYRSAGPRGWAGPEDPETNQTRLTLRQQTEERRRIFETSQDLILVLDSRGFLVQISPSCEAILGYRPEEMIGHKVEEFLGQEESTAIAALDQDVAVTRAPFQREIETRRSSGSQAGDARTMLMVKFPVALKGLKIG